ncbi:MAG: peptidoglycan DD-metalloendopeptidase family protein [Defluviitaleaceae bacterium]|nr:peptidoglycan DD-metalloendopeptidase family protein [Defluviitaleaceae bacterium]MCL2837010.1 peptidoglycan DD-metalloendopeptidase family protein [Defluviitaleaceae bacterium]
MSLRRRPSGERSADSLRHKGFYAALYSCVGVMLVLAVVIGYTNWNRAERGGDEGFAELPQYGTGDAGLAYSDPDEDLWQSHNYPAPALDADPANPFADEAAEVSGGREEPFLNLEDGEGDSDGDTVYGGDAAFTGDLDLMAGLCCCDIAAMTEASMPVAYLSDENLETWRRNQGNPSPEPQPTPEPEAFRSFNERADRMDWPVLGDIVMKYSVDHLIYDRTLEQYRTNDTICIGAKLGTPVTAATDGIVKEIFTTRENGRTVVVDHGNGWRTTYSQLQDDILVKAGDVVSKGQQIGSIGSPSLYSSQLGAHLAFSVHKDYNTVDPSTVLR